VWPDVAHMLTLERTDAFAESVLLFLAEGEGRSAASVGATAPT
jgi:hypothetical protein